MVYDVVVIGGGVVGALTLRSLMRYELTACLLEKKSDVGGQASSANSGIVHAGFDAAVGTQKAKFNVLGNAMMQKTCEELGVKYKNNGSLVLAFGDDDDKTLLELKERGEQNGVSTQILTKDEVLALEPVVSDNVTSALLAPSGGIVCPYTLSIQAVGNAMDNGADLKRDFEVEKIVKVGDVFEITATNGETVLAKTVVNAAGLQSAEIAAKAGDGDHEVKGRKGEYVLLDKKSLPLTHTLFTCPSKKGKGVLVSPTVDGNILLGPTADEVDNDDNQTTASGIDEVISKAREMVKYLPLSNVITSFAGTRAYSVRHDFELGESKKVSGLFNAIGVESPGLTSSPAIGETLANEIAKKLGAKQNEWYMPDRQSYDFFSTLSDDEKNELIEKNADFGEIVCRCESITAGEIINAIRRDPRPVSVDGVKKRVRAGMGRCQGGFCMPKVIELIARENGGGEDDVTKNGKGKITFGRLK